jgi:hypothetical protein
MAYSGGLPHFRVDQSPIRHLQSPNGLRLSGDGGEAGGVRCSRGLGAGGVIKLFGKEVPAFRLERFRFGHETAICKQLSIRYRLLGKKCVRVHLGSAARRVEKLEGVARTKVTLPETLSVWISPRDKRSVAFRFSLSLSNSFGMRSRANEHYPLFDKCDGGVEVLVPGGWPPKCLHAIKRSYSEPPDLLSPQINFPSPNGWRLSGDGGGADGVRCSRGLGNTRSHTLIPSSLIGLF